MIPFVAHTVSMIVALAIGIPVGLLLTGIIEAWLDDEEDNRW